MLPVRQLDQFVALPDSQGHRLLYQHMQAAARPGGSLIMKGGRHRTWTTLGLQTRNSSSRLLARLGICHSLQTPRDVPGSGRMLPRRRRRQLAEHGQVVGGDVAGAHDATGMRSRLASETRPSVASTRPERSAVVAMELMRDSIKLKE